MFTTRPELRGTFGMVASTHWLASAAGMAVLERGGNAFDAAVAAGFTLQVVEPHLNGPGGEVPAVFWPVERGEPLVLCGQGVAPAAATIERFRELGHDLIPGTGLLAACVPGAFGGWLTLLRDFGTLAAGGRARASRSATRRTAIPVVEGMRMTIERAAELLETGRRRASCTCRRREVGARFRNPRTRRHVPPDRRRGRAAARATRRSSALATRFYEGFVAEEIHRFCDDGRRAAHR